MAKSLIIAAIRRVRIEAIPALVIVIGVVATLAGGMLIDRISESRAHQTFNGVVYQAHDAIHYRLQTYVTALRATAGLFAGSEQVSPSEFRAFARRVELDRRYPGILGIGYSLRVKPGGEAALVARMRAEGVPEFRLYPTSRGGEIYPVLCLEPDTLQNRPILGFDLFSDPAPREAMIRARDTGHATLTGKVKLVTDTGSGAQAAFLIYEPVYRGGMVPTTIEERRERLQGFVYIPFRAGELLRNIFLGHRLPVDYAVYDGDPKPENLLHRSAPTADAASYGGYREVRALPIAGRSWTVVYTAGPHFEAAPDRRMTLAFVAMGLLATLLIAWATHQEVRARLAAEREVAARIRAESRQKLLLAELNHRVKNTLAAVQSIAAQTLRNAGDLETGRRNFEGRLIALSRAHDLLTRTNWRGARLGDLIRAELEPYKGDAPRRATVHGEAVWLAPDTAVALGMAFHELATNAAKHGALSVPGGRVNVGWTVDQSPAGVDRVSITWRERGGPPVRKPTRRGFGTRLLVAGLAHQLGGEVVVDFDPEGVVCTITFDLHSPQEFGAGADTEDAA